MLAFFGFSGIIANMIQTNDTQQQMYTLVLTSNELELLFDKLNGIVPKFTDDEIVVLRSTINDKVYKGTL